MPLAVVLALEPERDYLLPPFLGRAAHAALLGLVEAHDAALSARLHDEPGPRPFTLAVLEEGGRQGLRETAARAGQRLHLRVTLLDDALAPALLEALRSASVVELVHGRFRVGSRLAEPEEHPVAGSARYEALAERWLFPGPPLPRRLRFRFFSPTTFHSRGRHVPLPLPHLVFGSLAERWNAYAPVCLSPEVVSGLGEQLAVGRYRLETRLVDFGAGKQVGYLGTCEFVLLEAEPAVAGAAHLLARYAFFSGVGHKVTMGLGQAWEVSGAHPLRD